MDTHICHPCSHILEDDSQYLLGSRVGEVPWMGRGRQMHIWTFLWRQRHFSVSICVCVWCVALRGVLVQRNCKNMIYIYTLTEQFDPLKNKNIYSNSPPPPQIEYRFFGSFQGLARLSPFKGRMMTMKMVVKLRSVRVGVDRMYRITRERIFL